MAVWRGDMLWNGGRSLPLLNFWRPKNFHLHDMPDLTGKVAFVTGASTGIGLEVARQLARANATVYVGCRDVARCLEGATALRLDLADLQQTADVAEWLAELPALHILVNNAGVATQFPHNLTRDGVEATFQVNYLGHFLLTRRLLPLLQRSGARVVQLTSGAHRAAPGAGVPLSLAGINDQGAMGPYVRYGTAKLASLLLAQEVSRRADRVYSNAVHPGVVASDMLRLPNFQAMLGAYLGPVAFYVAKLRNRLFAYSVEEAALSLLFCAASPEVEARPLRGALVVPTAQPWPPRHPAAESGHGTELWDFSAAACDGSNQTSGCWPWGAFVASCWLSAFRAKYLFPYTVDLILLGLILAWVASVLAAVYARFRISEPTWYTYLCCALGIAVLAGPCCGDWIFRSLTQHYYRVGDLKTITGVDVAVEKGDSMLDAGIVEFAKGNYLDEMRSWHFKHHTAYCVAPVVTNRTAGPSTGSYDFWAVGKGCCSLTSSDFRCGAWGHPHADRAIRVLADEDVPYYRLAVQQAETLYGVVAANPVFFKWSDDPQAEVAAWFSQAWKNFFFISSTAFLASLLSLSCVAYRFSWLAPGYSLDPQWILRLDIRDVLEFRTELNGKYTYGTPGQRVEPHHTVLDLCAAPGSKTFQMLEAMHWPQAEGSPPPSGMILANELQWRRANMLTHQVGRLGSPCMVVVNCDAQFFPEMSSVSSSGAREIFRFDRVLCDVPCSGDGTLRKNPYIWKSWTPRDGLCLHIRQLNILYRGLELLKVGGRLVYSTCSLNPIEDEAVVAAALRRHGASVALVPPPESLSRGCPGRAWALNMGGAKS
ncbi:unnamed protein product [Effrenium voratum]|nr:unnamed protein product [Effrenium voratum]